MKIAVTFPGKFGDLLWALPTVRAISRRIDAPVDLFVAKPFASITPLLVQQSYIGVCAAIDLWEVQDTAPMSPRAPQIFDAYQGSYNAILHLGYRDWPLPDVVRHTLDTANQEGDRNQLGIYLEEHELGLQEPWITIEGPGDPVNVAVGFTDEYFELKYGLLQLLERRFQYTGLQYWKPLATTGRWLQEAGITGQMWSRHARDIRNADIVLADCSALHVLAVAMGVPAVLMEPQEMRWNSVFYPLGMDGPQVTMVRGHDGNPTFDARHVADTLQRVLERRRS